MDDVKMRYV